MQWAVADHHHKAFKRKPDDCWRAKPISHIRLSIILSNYGKYSDLHVIVVCRCRFGYLTECDLRHRFVRWHLGILLTVDRVCCVTLTSQGFQSDFRSTLIDVGGQRPAGNGISM